MQTVMSDPRMTRETAAFPPKVKSWTGLQFRRANRVLYHLLFPKLVAEAEPVGLARVMQYVGRGSIVGEIGVVRRSPRTATCVAYSHHQVDRDATDVELVRVPADVVYEIEAKSKRVRADIAKLIESREKRSADRSRAPVEALAESRRAEELGLLQGQNLMLIDLDRCTRCGDCVQACIDTHDDGYSRLFLDGPRFGKYLIPSSCRQCRDPVCMIGCPVGSIQQGDDGEIRIREWCIGCGLCAGQCPYDSIQMHDAAVLPSGAPGWLWIDGTSAVVDGNWHQLSCKETHWRPAGAPFLWGIEMLQALSTNGATNGDGKERRLYFRMRLRVDRARHASMKYRLLITSQGSSLEAYLNAQRVELTQDAAQKKRSQFVADIGEEMLRQGENLLAIAVVPPAEFNATVLDARLDALAPESEEAEEKLVTERAVVCDQCSSLSGERHACVYACPHEAAMRVDTWLAFPAN
jgi:Fe-S-cluster-containing dehydrogenase component